MKRNPDLVAGMLDAAERLFVRNGDRGMTVRPLAKEANTTSQTIYTYFGSRDKVIAEMCTRAVKAVLDPDIGWVAREVARLKASDTRVLPELTASFLELLDQHPVLRRFLIDQAAPEDIDDEPVTEAVRKITVVFDVALERDQRPDGEDAARLYIAQLVGIAGALDTGFCRAGNHRQIIDLLLGGEVLA